MGHKDIQTTLRYAHLSQDHKRDAISSIGKLLTIDTNMDTKPQENEKGAKVISLAP
jgi:translation elongation factor EF-G